MRALGSLRMIPLLVDRLTFGVSPYLDGIPAAIDIPAGIEGTALLVVQFRPTDPSFGVSTLELRTSPETDFDEVLATIAAVETEPDSGVFGPMVRTIEIAADKINRQVILLADIAEGEIYDVAVSLLVDEGKTPGQLGGASDYDVDGTPYVDVVPSPQGAVKASLYSGSVNFDDVDVASSSQDLSDGTGFALFMASYDTSEGIAADADVSGVIQQSDDDGDEDPWAPIPDGPTLAGDDPFPGVSQDYSVAVADLKRFVRVLLQGSGTTGARPFRVDLVYQSTIS